MLPGDLRKTDLSVVNAARRDGTGLIYFRWHPQDGGPVSIGHTSNIPGRDLVLGMVIL